MEKDKKGALDVIGCLAVLFTWPITFVISYVLYGWALNIVWARMFVPKFGLPPLDIAEAIFFALVIGFLCKNVHADTTIDKQKSDIHWLERYISATITTVIHPLVFLLICGIVAQFLPVY